MKNSVMVFCDEEADYAFNMTEFMKNHQDAPWDIYTCTSVKKLMELADQMVIEILVVAENSYLEEVRSLVVPATILLNESGIVRWEDVCNVDKYQAAEHTYREILCTYLDITTVEYPRLKVESKVCFIGMYSPVRRCLQTSFALTLGQMLSRKYKTLYLNFEHYVGNTELLPDNLTRDLADLLYFINAKNEKFALRMRTMIQKKGEMDYIPPMRAGQNLLLITPEEWNALLEKLMELNEYDYIILDLSENMQGLLEILRHCYRVFTLTKDDVVAQGKINQYEQILSQYKYDDVLAKTSKCKLPLFRNLPETIEEFTKGDLADYIETVIEEVLI